MSAPKLELYYFEACPFCMYVLQVIDEHKIKVDYKHVRKEPENLEKLLQDTGRTTVPCLYINGKPMHESADIVQWLENNLDNLEKIS